MVQLRAEPDQHLVAGQNVHLDVDPTAGACLIKPAEPSHARSGAAAGREPVLPELG